MANTTGQPRIEVLLEEVIKKKASDLHLQVGLAPILRIDGALTPVHGADPLTEESIEVLIFAILDEDQKQILLKDKEFDFSFAFGDLGRFRVNAFHERGNLAAALRLIPNMDLWRPCDTVEAAVAWSHAVKRQDGPTCLVYSRQNSAFQKRDADTLANVARGGYVLSKEAGTLKAVIIATGTEVPLAIDAQKQLAGEGVHVRVVSMPSTFVFDKQDAAYRASVLPTETPRVAVEAGITDYWRKYVGLDGAVIGIDTFGESAPAGVLYKHFGITAEAVAKAVRAFL